MKHFPIVLGLACAALLTGCGRPVAGPSDNGQQDEQRLIEEKEAFQLSQLHEREAALDERERLLDLRQQQLATASTPSPGQTVEAPEPEQAGPGPTPIATPTPSIPAAASAAPPGGSPNASYQSFYDALAPYGSWVQIPNYDGYLWQPAATVQNPFWRPYTLGHWVYTDEGWTWVSDEPFGWITYHYGRWMRTRTLGWVWAPGDQWAPAWVSWRYGDDYVGWAPLPPEAGFNSATGIQQWADQQYSLGPSDYTFVPAAAFGDDNMADDEAPPDQAAPIFDDSNNITNIYYDSGAYAIICYGPNYEFMRSKARRPLAPPYTLRRAGFHAGGKNGAVVSGKTLEVAAPRIVRDARPGAPRIVRGIVIDTRLIAGRSFTPNAGMNVPPGPAAGIPRPTQPAQPAYGARIPSQANPVTVPLPAGGVAVQPGAPAAMGIAPPGAANADAQRAHDIEIIQQQQAARERQIAEEARIAAEEQSAAEAARARHAEEEAAAKTAHEQESPREEAAHQAQVSHAAQPSQASQPAHSSQPASVPAGNPGPVRGQQ
jgi:hypothetical protein